MASYVLTSPEGKKYRITAPDDATEEQVMQYFHENKDSVPEIETPKEPVSAVDTYDKIRQKQMQAWPDDPTNIQDRFQYGLEEPLFGIGQLVDKLVPKELSDKMNQGNQWLYEKTGGIIGNPDASYENLLARREKEYPKQEGIDLARTTGNIISGIPLAAAASPGILPSAVSGGAIAATTPVYEGDFQKEKLKQVSGGATMGAILGLADKLLRPILAPNLTQKPGVANLEAQGIEPTIGQRFGGRTESIENVLSRMPITRDAVEEARLHPVRQFNEANLNRVDTQIGVPKEAGYKNNGLYAGREAIDETHTRVSKHYEDVLNSIGKIKFNSETAMPKFSKVLSLADELPVDQRRTLNKMVARYNTLLTSKDGSAKVAKDIISELNDKIPRYRKSMIAGDNFLADHLSEVRNIIHEEIRLNNPVAKKSLEEADRAFSDLVTIENAANRRVASNTSGIYQPEDYLSAVKSADTSARKNMFSRGQSRNQDFARDAVDVLGRNPRAKYISRGQLIHAARNPLETILAGSLSNSIMSPYAQNTLAKYLSRSKPSSLEEVLRMLTLSASSNKASR